MIENNSFNFYTYMDSLNDITEILEEMKKVTSLFLDIVYKLKNNRLKIKNIVMTRNLENLSDKFRDFYNEKVIAENGVGLKIKTIDNKSGNILACSYLISDDRIEKLVYNLESEIDNLYNFWV